MNRPAVAFIGILSLALFLTPVALAQQSTIGIPANNRATVLTLNLKTGDTVSYSWSSNASVTFRIQDSAGTNLVSVVGQTGSGNWQSPEADNYTFQFRNTNQFGAQVQWTINQQGVLPLTTIYFVVGLAALGAVVGAVYTMRKHRSSK